MAFEFSDPKIERMVALTPADRKWMDDVVRTVEESWEVVSLQLAQIVSPPFELMDVARWTSVVISRERR